MQKHRISIPRRPEVADDSKMVGASQCANIYKTPL